MTAPDPVVGSVEWAHARDAREWLRIEQLSGEESVPVIIALAIDAVLTLHDFNERRSRDGHVIGYYCRTCEHAPDPETGIGFPDRWPCETARTILEAVRT